MLGAANSKGPRITAAAKLTSTMVNYIFDDGILTNYELTKLFSAEFIIRPFIVKHCDE